MMEEPKSYLPLDATELAAVDGRLDPCPRCGKKIWASCAGWEQHQDGRGNYQLSITCECTLLFDPTPEGIEILVAAANRRQEAEAKCDRMRALLVELAGERACYKLGDESCPDARAAGRLVLPCYSCRAAQAIGVDPEAWRGGM